MGCGLETRVLHRLHISFLFSLTVHCGDVQGCHNISYTQMYTVIGWAGPAPAPTYLNIRNNKILNSKNHEWMGGGARHYGYSVVLGERQSIDSEITGQWT